MARTLHLRQREITGPIAIRRPWPSARAMGDRFVATVVRPLLPGARLSEVAAFFRNFATLVGAGIPLYQALESMSRQTRSRTLAQVADEAARRVMEGKPFSDVLASRPYLFSPLHVELIRFAETTGRLDTTLDLVADFAERELNLRHMLSRLTFYPKLLAVVAILICGRALFGGGSMAIVSLVLGGSVAAYLADTVGLILQILLLAFGAVAVVRIALFSIPQAPYAYETVKMALPGIGACVKRFAFARFGRAFGAAYQAGLPMYSALRVAGSACGSRTIDRAVSHMIGEIDRGYGLADAARSAGVFSPIVIQMLETGEMTGNVDLMMAKAAEYLENDAQTKAHQYAWVFSTGVYLMVALIIANFMIGAWGGYAAGMSSALSE